MLDGKIFRGDTGTPMRRIARANSSFAEAEPEPLMLANLMTKSFTASTRLTTSASLLIRNHVNTVVPFCDAWSRPRRFALLASPQRGARRRAEEGPLRGSDPEDALEIGCDAPMISSTVASP